MLIVLLALGFARISTRQLESSVDRGNRNIVLNYGNQVAARLHDLFERVDVSLSALSLEIAAMDDDTSGSRQARLENYEQIWAMDESGLMYADGENILSSGDLFAFENEISLRDVLSYSQKLNISRQNVAGEEMLVFAKPCQTEVGGRLTNGIFAAMRLERVESLLGTYGYGNDSFLVLTRSNGDNIWKQNTGRQSRIGVGNCFDELSGEDIIIADGDSVLQMETRMNVAMDGTIAYSMDGQDYFMSYVPLEVNYWYLLVSVPSDAIDLTALARRHTVVSATLTCAIVVTGAACIFYLTQRNRSITRYNEQLKVAADMANQAARAEQANKAKQEFLAKVSHDLRTPLNGVVGMLALAGEGYSDEERCREYLSKASMSAQYLLELLNDVLDMSQIESGKPALTVETVDMKALLAEVATVTETVASQKGISFSMEDSALAHRYFTGDHLRLKQILMNLCTNAVKYTQPGGWVALEVGETEREGEPIVVFRISDNGEGIAKEKQETIFLPFEQASGKRSGGVGLGLSIVRSFVELMGGEITVESELGAGSTFTVTLPLACAEPAECAGDEAEEHDLQGVSILLAEDNEINAEIAITLLELRGACVTHVPDGEAAVEAFREAPAGTYQVVLMDIQMPKMDGLEATRRIRALKQPDGAAIPILAMTANAFHEQQDEMAEAGMNDFLYKPIDIGLVCRTIIKWTQEESLCGVL